MCKHHARRLWRLGLDSDSLPKKIKVRKLSTTSMLIYIIIHFQVSSKDIEGKLILDFPQIDYIVENRIGTQQWKRILQQHPRLEL